MYQWSEVCIKGVKDVSRERRIYQGSEGCSKGVKGVSRE